MHTFQAQLQAQLYPQNMSLKLRVKLREWYMSCFCVTRIVEKYSVFNTKSTSNQHGAVEKISTGCIDKNARVWYNISIHGRREELLCRNGISLSRGYVHLTEDFGSTRYKRCLSDTGTGCTVRPAAAVTVRSGKPVTILSRFPHMNR